jgi:CubicO group peptidase (beta-lactamase class C family)
MNRSALLSDLSFPFPHAHGYDGRIDLTRVYNPSIAGAAGAVVSTAGGLVRFFRALLAGRLLSRAALAEVLRTVNVGVGLSYGLGVFRIPTPCGAAWGHSGGIPGYQTLVLASPNGRRVSVVLVNSMPPPGGDTIRVQAANAHCAR